MSQSPDRVIVIGTTHPSIDTYRLFQCDAATGSEDEQLASKLDGASLNQTKLNSTHHEITISHTNVHT